MVVLNHLHSIKNFVFSSAQPCDFDGMLGTGIPLSLYTTKTPIDKCRCKVIQLKEFFTISVKDRYQLNYFICNQRLQCTDNCILKIKFVLFLCCDVWNVRQTTSGVYAITVTTSTCCRCGRL
jgi:hypothetical protein